MWNALGLWIANRNGSSSRQAARRRKRTAPSFDGLEGRRLLTSVVYQSGTIPADVAAEAVYVGSVQGTSYALMSNGDVDEYGNNTGVDPSTNLSTVSSDGNTVTTVNIAGQTWQFTDAGWNVPGSGTAPTGTPTPAPTPSPTGTPTPTPTDTTTPQDPTSDSPQDGSNTGSQPQQPSSQESGGNQQKKVAPHSNHVQHKPIVVHQKRGRIKE